MHLWKISLEIHGPNGRRLHGNLPYRVWTMVRLLASLLRFTCQYPERRSTLLTTLAPTNSCMTSLKSWQVVFLLIQGSIEWLWTYAYPHCTTLLLCGDHLGDPLCWLCRWLDDANFLQVLELHWFSEGNGDLACWQSCRLYKLIYLALTSPFNLPTGRSNTAGHN